MAHVLVADDDDEVRGVIVSALRIARHEVDEARDGREAVERFLAAPADVVLMDLLMPVKDGIEAILDLRCAAPAVKIIAMSGGGQIAASDYLAWAQTIGVTHTLEKPFSLRDLLALIDELVQT